NGAEIDQPRMTEIQTRLEALWHAQAEAGHPTPPAGIHTSQPEAMPTGPAGWQISFCPHPYMLMSGNDPVRILRELETLGTLTVHVDMTRLPALAELDPETCYLAWELTLHGDIAQKQVSEVFEWVEGDCALTLRPLSPSQPALPESASQPEPASQ